MDGNVGEVEVFKESYIWVIKKFTKALKSKKLENFKSPSFRSGSIKGLYPEYFIVLLMDCQDISLSISLKTSMLTAVNVTCRISLINSSGNFVNTKLIDFQFVEKVACQFDKYLKKDYVIEHLDDLVLNDSLRLYCEIVNKDTCIINMPIHRVSEDYELIFENPLLSDAIVVASDAVFPVHKVMLSARSPVFSEMLSAATQLSNENFKIKIKDLSDNVIKEVLRFIYSGKVNNIYKLADDLLVAADKYKIEELKTISEYSLCKTITTQNVAKRLLLANNHSAENLKKDAVLYIYKNRKQVINTEGYKLIESSHPSILAEAFQILLSKHN